VEVGVVVSEVGVVVEDGWVAGWVAGWVTVVAVGHG
jgi:hypothetical protein